MDGVGGAVEGDLVAGRYRLLSVLGIGSSALVRAGWDERTGRRVAVKLIHAHAGEHERRQYRREVAALGRLRHPGVVGLVASGTHAGQPYLVTDLVDGPTLAERIVEGPLEAHRVRRIGIALAGALAHVHAAGVVHRDLKPANVLLGDDGRPRLADFGISRPLDGAVETDAGTVVGTAAFLAPEQAQGALIGPAADVYSLGLVLLEAVTGRREYPGPAAESAVARLHRAPDVPEDLPGAMTPALRAMTAADPGNRPTAAEVVDLFAPVRPPVAAGGRARHRRARGRHRSPRPLVAVAAGLLAGGAAAFALLDVPAPVDPVPVADPVAIPADLRVPR